MRTRNTRKLSCTVNAETKASGRFVKLVQETARLIPSHLPGSAWKLKGRGMEYEVAISLVSPRRIHHLNKTYRGKDKPTDVLAFPLWEKHPVAASVHVGDICLCPQVARKYARELGHSLEQELRILTVHGILHLFGYDHETNDADARRMFRLQNKIVDRL